MTFGLAVMGHLMGQAYVQSEPPVQIVDVSAE
jgi:hypothetical protein